MSLNVFYLDYSMLFGNIIDKNFKSLCNLLWIFETRIAITIMTNQHQQHDCEEDITILDMIKIIAQPHIWPEKYCMELNLMVAKILIN